MHLRTERVEVPYQRPPEEKKKKAKERKECVDSSEILTLQGSYRGRTWEKGEDILLQPLPQATQADIRFEWVCIN